MSRRNFLRGGIRGGAAKAAAVVAAPMAAMEQAAAARQAQVAPAKKKVFVLARACLAYQGSFCSVCREQCPVEGAIRVENGRPFIMADICTACGVCKEVCPAPRNAILVMDDPGPDPGSPGMGTDAGGVAAFLPKTPAGGPS